SSGLMGTVSGSPIANVVTTGTFTIPLMKSSGFDTEMAGAVEAAASTGGSLMPPIMASAAFIMAEYLGIPYSTIALAALVPAICYYLSIYINVHLYSKKHQLVGMKEVPAWRDVIKDMYLLIPLAAVFITIFAGKTPLNAALWGIISCVAVSFFRKKSRITPKRFINALGKSSLTGLEAYMACIIVGIPVGVIVMTGLGRVLADLVVGVSGAQLYLMLLISAIAALLMSMGLPTVPLYIVCATTIAPALVSLGILPLAAHLFVLYWGVLSNLTPPVALASYAAAGLCGGDLNQVAWKALKLTLPTFLIPFAFVLNPGILLQGDVLNIIQTCLTITLGSGALAVAVAGYTHRPLKSIERMLIAVGAVLLIDPRGFT
ncbi:MAG TPA: C4-dicarboxylate ABC transporter permease, partial [Firmicutes bacterium]|nr:C4-dicarboxylate ABC transporter permease [Bacillota bacterium]